MFTKILELILSKVGESFLSRVAEQTADTAVNNVKSIKDFELSLIYLREKLMSLSAKASDVEKKIKNAERSGQKKRKREVEEWLGEVKAIEKEVVDLGTLVDSEGFTRRLIDGGNIAQLNEQVDELVEQSRNFCELLLDVCGTGGVTLLTPNMVGEAFQGNLEKLWRLMETGEVSCIGLHGMGGAGKTTLAKHIHNLLQEKSQVRVFWVTVSEKFTIKILQDKIARCLGIELSDEDHEDIRAVRLHGVLSQEKKSVVILDDVWENIDLLKVGCSVPVECCRLIITTRSLEVCRRIGCKEVIAVKKLDEDEAWNLFTETLGNVTKLGPQVEEIAKRVARMCDGLPLGIVTLAGSMRDETEIHIWRSALEELKKPVSGQDITGGVEIFEVLKYSFDRLNRNHQSQSNEEFNLFQSCFLYCSLYPEDHKIPRGELVGRFISEGLLDRSSRRAQLDLGYSILDKLVKVCLMESCVDDDDDDNDIKCVKMHDLIRGMALKIVGGKYMVRAGDMSMKEIPMEEEWTKDLEKVSLMNNWIGSISEGASPNCPKLSTLLLHGNFPLKVIPDSFLSKMQGLSTLDLGSTRIKMLPNSLSELISLKALLLEECSSLEKVPNMGKLKALRELNLSGTAIKEIPQGVEELLNLKFLSICARQLEVLRRGLLFKLVHLQYVMFPFHIAAPIEGIENLKQLEVFRGRVNDLAEFKCFITSRVRDTSYNIVVGWCSPYELFPPKFNKSVLLMECSLKHEIVLWEEIEFITITRCLCESNCLLDDFSGIECIWKSQQLMRPQRFPSQIQLRASSQVVFSSVRKLHVSECHKITKLGLPVLALPNLEDIYIECCGEMEEIFEDEGRGSVTLPKLKWLRLSHLPRLKSLCMAPIICNSIQYLLIEGCPSLMKKLPLLFDVSPPPSLDKIEVEREWWESLEWDNPDLPHRLQPFLNLF